MGTAAYAKVPIRILPDVSRLPANSMDAVVHSYPSRADQQRFCAEERLLYLCIMIMIIIIMTVIIYLFCNSRHVAWKAKMPC